LFQLTGALRNVAGEEEMFPQFVSTGAVNELCKAMELFSSELDVISNISRTLRYSSYTINLYHMGIRDLIPWGCSWVNSLAGCYSNTQPAGPCLSYDAW
jgi:hypothetical protein